MDTYKCHVLILDFKYPIIWAKLGKDVRWEKSDVKLFGVTINKILVLDEYISKWCSKYKRKLSTLS